MAYTLHPSEKLVTLFREKPWQGCDPATAQFLFIGLDANYAADIEDSLPEVFDYLRSGVDFWRASGVHHPFRLPKYQGSGKRYHDKFAEIGFQPRHADTVSFVELLHLPTVGRRSLSAADLSMDHMAYLQDIIKGGAARCIVTFPGVVSLMRQTKLFPWLPQKPKRMEGALGVLLEQNGQTIYQMYHLSCHYDWQQELLDRQIVQLHEIVDTLYKP